MNRHLFRITLFTVTLLATLLLLGSPAAQAVSTTLVINEIDYDQASTDAAEFLELKNVSSGAINLDLYAVELVNGTGGGAALYQTIDLPNVNLAAGDYFVVCANAATTANCDLDVAPDTNLIQNGAPDAVGLRLSGALVDAVSYEGNSGAPYTEGSGTGLEDNPDTGLKSIGRCPDGADTDQNNIDFAFADISPGATNNCPLPGIELTIMQIQGLAHKSTYLGETALNVPGIVTVVRGNGFYMQDPAGDGNVATSDAIFVFSGSAPAVAVGDSVTVNGLVAEFYPGGFASGNLSTTELTGPAITVVSSGNALPATTIIGNGGRVPPNMVIDDDATGDVETTGSFDPTTDGIDFYESLEAMRVQVNDAIAVGPTNPFGEIPVVGDGGANAGLLSPRGGIVIQAGDFNPERVILDDTLMSVPIVSTGDSFTSPIIGVMDYSFGNFKLFVNEPMTAAAGGLAQETTTAAVAGELSIASFNVLNLDPGDGPAKFDALAAQIVNNLQAPDILGLIEVQDNSGPVNNGVVDASLTYTMLAAAIQAAGGPAYEFRDIPPVNNQDGGEPGGNIRVGFFFRPDRVSFVDRPGGGPTTATTVSLGASGVELSASPGRIDPTNTAFTNSRKPLAAEFLFQGEQVIIVHNHFNSKGGDNPLFGRIQPPVLTSEAQRLQQAQVVNNFVDDILALDASANVVVMGDLNDFPFSPPLATVAGDVLTNLVATLPLGDQYTFIFDGNSQVLDNFLVSDNLLTFPTFFDIVHANVEFAASQRPTDHDPVMAQFCLDTTPPTLAVSLNPNVLWPPNHKYVTVQATVSVNDNADPAAVWNLVSVTSSEPDSGLDPQDLPNDIVIVDSTTFLLRAERGEDGPGRTYSVTYQATDACGNVTVATATVFVPHDQSE
ncbi:MAG: lamin tail domain-containing protein [Chloroflexi bacterium]|nr:lamin tail domain-containing protein [Chloroflexota bacterium]